jgi:hypothetical protein
MGGGGGSTSTSTGGGSTTTTPPPTTPAPGVSTEFQADRPQRMPVYNSPAQIESARQRRQQIIGRTGRTSTNLTGNPGTRSYMNSFLGSVG